ncbi:outer membrane protein TOM13-domain-containing protein [Gigaspora rosea]|uniref:Outer membrane protein TOM13-domain-containing protein n=1 Tax=Gigaspora rosea TaxID=44941 RepID=A0A397V881_9GLOM|nr:outer membrane protein TOM13-domain-containing protein [Gigaspora rosea]
MPDNASPLLAATIAADDMIPHVVLNTSIGSPPHSDSGIPPSLSRRGSFIPPNIYHRQRNTDDTVVPFYRRPQFYSSILRTFAFNFFFPFINGVMLGFGEICANELAFRMGWFGARSLPLHYRRTSLARNRETNKSKNVNGRETEVDDENDKTVYVDMAPLN